MVKKKKHKLTPAMKAQKWTKGQSGNPGGRPKGKTVFSRIKEMLGERALAGETGKTRLDTVAHAYIRACEAGSFVHTNALIEREDGKVPLKVKAETENVTKFYEGGMPVGDHPDAP